VAASSGQVFDSKAIFPSDHKKANTPSEPKKAKRVCRRWQGLSSQRSFDMSVCTHTSARLRARLVPKHSPSACPGHDIHEMQRTIVGSIRRHHTAGPDGFGILTAHCGGEETVICPDDRTRWASQACFLPANVPPSRRPQCSEGMAMANRRERHKNCGQLAGPRSTTRRQLPRPSLAPRQIKPSTREAKSQTQIKSLALQSPGASGKDGDCLR